MLHSETETNMSRPVDLVQGTLDLLILWKTLFAVVAKKGAF